MTRQKGTDAARGSRYAPRVVVTDGLASYIAPCADLGRDTVHRRDKGLNDRAGNSHQPTRERERRMRGFKSPATPNAWRDRRSVLCWQSLAVGVELSDGIGLAVGLAVHRTGEASPAFLPPRESSDVSGFSLVRRHQLVTEPYVASATNAYRD